MNSALLGGSNNVIVVKEQTRLLYRSINVGLLASVINSAVLVTVLWPVVNHIHLSVWLCVLYLVSLLRWGMAFQFNKQAKTNTEEDATKWYRLYLVGALAAASVWAGASLVIFPRQDITYQLFFTFVLGGLATGSLINHAFEKNVARLFLIIVMVPLIVQVALSQSPFSSVMALLLSYFLVANMLFAGRFSANVEKNIQYEQVLKGRKKELQQSENRYKVLIQTASDAFFLHDLTGRFIDVNQQACDSLGYSREELLNMSVKDIEKGADEEVLRKTWPTLNRIRKLEMECLHQCKDGTLVPVEVHLGPVEIGDEKYISAFVRDITVHKEAIASAEQAKVEAQRHSDAKSRFLSHISHELRTPLNAVLGFAQLLEMNGNNFSETQRLNVKEIVKSAGFLLEMINELLDLSRIESGGLELSCDIMAPQPLLLECLYLLERQADNAEVSLASELNTRDCLILADAKRVKQVFLNLLSNGIKYNSSPGSLFVKSEIKDGNRLLVTFTDSGKGLSQEQQKSLFTPFLRLDSTPDIEGTGIGLVISKKLMEAMGGQIGVNSIEGQGCSFWLSFPLVNASS